MDVGALTRVLVRAEPPRRPGAPGDAFRMPAAATPCAPAAAPLADGLLALQAGDAQARDREARRRGQAALLALAALQRALLCGEDDPEALRSLAAACEAPEAADPALASVLRGVALRARVELARRGL